MWSPLGDEAPSPGPTWHPEPQTRGTFSILSTCILTIGLCVWTAVHLNIPEHGKTGDQPWRKAKYLIIGLLAPEVIAFIAFHQWHSRKRLQVILAESLKEISPASQTRRWFKKRKRIDTPEPPSQPMTQRRRWPWTSTHSIYALMGGFVFDFGNRSNDRSAELSSRVTLTAKAIIFLAKYEPDMLPDISEEQIRDKSKADGLGKTLVIFQATVFSLQVLVRLATRTPITLLEINTFAHTLFTFIVYAMWWNKPLDIAEPSVIPCFEGRAASIAAGMWTQSRMGYLVKCPFKYRNVIRQMNYKIVPAFDLLTEYGLKMVATVVHDHNWHARHVSPNSPPNNITSPDITLRPSTRGVERNTDIPLETRANMNRSEAPRSEAPRSEAPRSEAPRSEAPRSEVSTAQPQNTNPVSSEASPASLTLGQSSNGVSFVDFRILQNTGVDMNEGFLERKAGRTLRAIARAQLTADMINRFSIAREALTEFEDLHNTSIQPSTEGGKKYQKSADYVIPRMPNWPRKELELTGSSDLTFMIALFGGGMVYGALHLLAWEGLFISELEALLWRASGIILLLPPLIWLAYLALVAIGVLLVTIFPAVQSVWDKLQNPLIVAVVGSFFLYYLAARGYLLVACLVHLAHSPAGVFKTVSLYSYVPHVE